MIVNDTVKKALLVGFVAISYALYSYSQRHDSSSAVAPPSTTTQNTGGVGTSGSSASSGSTSTQPTSAYKDGTYTGNAADAYYGNIQVKAVIQGGKITDVIFLQYPNDRSNSVRINTQAMPYLKQEAIQAQSAEVDTVTGATDTSIAFQQSMRTALAQAK